VPLGTAGSLTRNAAIGFAASAVTDTLTNAIRVLKTYRQTSADVVSYADAARHIVRTDGLLGLWGRGLKTRLLSNGLQAALFSVSWKYAERLLLADSSTGRAASEKLAS